MDKGPLVGKWALVTGASSGLGVDFARVLASQTCNLVITARREERLHNLQEELGRDHGIDVVVMPTDLARSGAPEALLSEINQSGIKLDVLVNNAGFGVYGLFWEEEWNKYQAMIQVNVAALVELTNRVIKGMLEREYGRILLVASNAAFQPVPQYALYGATKSLVQDFGEALHYELRGTPVSCTVVSPGPTRTEFHDITGQSRQNVYIQWTMMESKRVAEIGIQAMLQGKPSVVPGRVNALFAWLAQRVPRRLATAIAGWAMGS